MSLVSPSQSAAGETIDAADINTPINQLAAVVNGNLDDDNISSVSGTKLVDGTVTNTKLSTATGELGGAWQSWTPTITGFSGTPTYVTKYIKIGSVVHVYLYVTGTSNAAGFTISLPVPVKTLFYAACRVTNNGTVSANPGMVLLDGSTATVFTAFNGTTFTASGTKTLDRTVIAYEAA